jgi:chromosome segregation ATPase
MPEGQTGPALKKLDITIARLRLLLADLGAREASLDAQRRTCVEQRNRLVTHSLYGESTLDSVLAMMADVEERLAHVEATLRSLATIRQRAEVELESLQLTKGVQEAQTLLSELQARRAQPDGALSPDEIQAEIARLQTVINEASERAARTIGRRGGR